MTQTAEQYEVPLTAELMRQLLLRTINAPGADYRVLTYFVTSAPLGMTVRKTFRDVAIELGISPPNVGKSVNRLAEARWLEVSHRIGRVTYYRVGPNVTTLAQRSLDDGKPTSRPADHDALATVTPLRRSEK